MIAKWNNKEFKLVDSVELKNSSQEVSFSDINVDFNNRTVDDLPYSQQEVNIYENDGTLKFVGFVDTYKLPSLTDINITNKVLSISLLSPRQMATKKTVTVSRTDTVENLIRQIIEPLIQDGFRIKEINIDNQSSSINLISRTVEEALNYFSQRFSIWWNIDKMKRITINSLNYQMNKEPVMNLNIRNYKKELPTLVSLQPQADNLGYANIINIKNARIFYNMNQYFYNSSGTKTNITLKENDKIDFENPIDISTKTTKRIYSENYTNKALVAGFPLGLWAENGNPISDIYNQVEIPLPDKQDMGDFGKDDSEDKKFILNMDSTFKNLATGFTYKGKDTITISRITSDSALRYANIKLYNNSEIQKAKGLITPSGQIEKTIDVQNGWYTEEEIINYIRTQFGINSSYTSSIDITLKEKNPFDIGDRIDIDLPEYYSTGIYIVTSISEKKDWNNPAEYTIELKNTGVLDNYIDLFRKSGDGHDNDSQIENEYVIEYEEDKVKEIHTMEFVNDDKNHTLNFELNK